MAKTFTREHVVINASNPYREFGFTVDFGEFKGRFSEVAGLTDAIFESSRTLTRVGIANVKENPKIGTTIDLTLKRGLVDADFYVWLRSVVNHGNPFKREMRLVKWDKTHSRELMTWLVRGIRPVKYIGPTLEGKGERDVEMEELVLTAEGLTAD